MNHTVATLASDSFSHNVRSTDAAVAVLFEDALDSFGNSRTPLAMAIRAVRFPAPTLVPRAMEGQNATSRWLSLHAKAVYDSLAKHLNAKMQRSGELNLLEDHIQEFLARLVRKDTLAPFLASGETPKLASLRVWVYQSACTELRRMGVDAAMRASRNAKTSREVQKGAAFMPVQSPDAVREVPTSSMDDSIDTAPDLYDPSEPTPEDVATHRSRIDHVRATLIRKGQAHLIPAVDGLLAGKDFTEIQATLGVSEDQLAKAVRLLRA